MEEDKIKNWVRNGIDNDTIRFADKFGKSIADNELTTSQIRNIFGEMRRIQLNGYDKEKTAFLLLKPKLAYAVKRNKNKTRGIEDFYDFFSVAYDAVDTKNPEGNEHFKNLMNILEAVLAYHKYHGGQD
ncbi:MAG: type III-A CRISPR-associated protein Csm2 [Bacteroidales bacterium]|nr:type III-A CRISPR-associated protein Csm2 [Bacteroidales bacterium]